MMKPNNLNRPNFWMGAALAVVTSVALAPEAIAQSVHFNSQNRADTAITIAQAQRETITARVVETSPREDTITVQLPNGNLRMLLVSAQDIRRLELAAGVDVTLNMEGSRVITMSRMMSIEPQENMSATILDTSPDEDTVRVRLADGGIRRLSIAAHEQLRLGLSRGSEVTLNMRGTRIVTMARNNMTVTVTEDAAQAF
ncbi:hypothetical protein ACQ4M4_15860 [Leptolyngbya sp. AN02str]|uniref:hypothetical protein n=1 Tax=Leptolyngbya sp. AN02str TaxID=3423363 RepID=UPI003D30F8CC